MALLKPQPLVLVPVVLLWLWRRHGWRALLRGAAGMAGIALACCWPYLLPPYPPEMIAFWNDLQAWANLHPFASVYAFNIWWLVGAFRDVNAPALGPLSPSLLGVLWFLGVFVLVMVGIWRNAAPQQLLLGAGLLGVGVFVLMGLQHERYLSLVLVPFLLSALHQPRYWLFYALATLTNLSNMVLAVLFYMVVPDAGVWVIPWREALAPYSTPLVLLTLLLAFTNLVLLALVIRAFWQSSLRSPTLAPALLPVLVRGQGYASAATNEDVETP